VAESDAALLEFGERTVIRLGGVIGGGVGKLRFGCKHGEDVLGVFLPVGGGVEVAAGLEFFA